MKRIVLYLLLLILMQSCLTYGPSLKKHSYETRSGRQKLKKFNALYNGADRIFDYRIKKVKKTYKKAGYKN